METVSSVPMLVLNTCVGADTHTKESCECCAEFAIAYVGEGRKVTELTEQCGNGSPPNICQEQPTVPTGSYKHPFQETPSQHLTVPHRLQPSTPTGEPQAFPMSSARSAAVFLPFLAS